MKLHLKRLLIFLVSVLVIIPLLALVASFALEDKIKQQMIVEINKQLTVPVKVSGKITFTLLKHFPNAALQFERVSIENKLKVGEKQLAEIQELSILFSLSDILKNKFTIHSVVLRNGIVNIVIDKNGKSNLSILKPILASEKSNTSFQISNILLSNIRVTYSDFQTTFKLNTRVRKLSLNGNFFASSLDLIAKGELFIESGETTQNAIIANKQLNVDILLKINNSWKNISFTNNKLIIEQNPFICSGTIIFEKESTRLHCKANTKGSNISDLISLFPHNLRKAFEEIKGKGAFEIDISVDGNVSKSESPLLKVKAKLVDCNVELPKVSRELNHVFANIEYGNDKAGSDYLHITDCRSQVSSESFRFSLFLKNLNNPEFVFDANGTLHLKELGAFVPDTIMKNFTGTIEFQNFSISGNLSDFNNPSSTLENGSGIFTLKNVGFEAGDIKYENINGIINYYAKNLSVKDLTINFLDTEATFNGKVSGLPAFATALAQRKPMNNLVLDAYGDLKINKLNLSNLIQTFSKKEEKSKRQKLDIKNVFRMNGNLSIEIQRFIYNKMNFRDVKISLTMSPLHLRLNNFYTQTMGGVATGNGYFVFTGENDLLMNLGLELADIDIATTFIETDNFGQSTLTSDHISGTANAKVYLKNIWKNYEQIDEDNLNAIVDFEIKSGRLKNFEPVKAASKFIRVEELSDIKFSDIKNRISIYNKTVFIPSFEIKSNAVNLIFSGEHHFDNTVDYHFKINLRRLLANKFNKSGREQYIENDPYDGLNVYLSMTGNLSNPSIKYDKASAAAKIKEDWRKEKDVLKSLFHPNSSKKGEKREEKYFMIDEQPVFMDFDDEKP